MELTYIVLAFLGGILAGIVNTFAGNGSIITLGILIDLLGLSGVVANATNRVGIFMQSATSMFVFHKKETLHILENKSIILTTLIGALVGVYIAIHISHESFILAYRILLVVMLLTLVFKPSRWIQPELYPDLNIPPALNKVFYFLVGVYGGFIQMGMGILFLAVSVLVNRKNFIQANIAKVSVIFVYTFFALVLFIYLGHIAWLPGLVIGFGQMIGAYMSAHYLIENVLAKKIAFVILVIVILLGILKLLF